MSPPGRAAALPIALAALAALATLVAMSLCAPAVSASEPGAQQSGKRVRALVLREARSPVIRALKRRLDGDLRIHRSSRIPVRRERRHQILIVDGDELSATELAQSPQLRRLAAAGRWVLAVDVGPRHHSRAIGRETGFEANADGHRSDAFLFRRTTIGGEPQIEMVDVPSLRPRGAHHHGSKRRKQARRRLARRVARIVHESIASDQLATAAAPAPGDDAVPAELQHIGWTYSVVGQATPKDGFWKKGNPLVAVPSPGTQTASWTMNHSFDVYLDNGEGHPQGNRQIITYALNGQFSPKRPSESFFHMYDDFHALGLGPYQAERAWWTGTIASTVTPDATTSSKLTWQASAPETPNAATHYSSGQDFSVGFTGSKEGVGVEATYAVHNSKSYSVPDWGVQNKGNGNSLNWLFSSRDPCDGRTGSFDRDKCFNVGAFKNGMPNLPNDLSTGQAQIHTNGRWATKGLLSDGSLAFTVDTPVSLVDTVCEAFGIGVCDTTFNGPQIDYTASGPPSQTFSFDPATVIPVPIDSLKLTPNPVQLDKGESSRNVTGTVTLKREAPMDVVVVVYSNSKNASVGAPTASGSRLELTIPKGHKSAEFTVKTNDNGLGPGAHVTAAITAFYGDATVEQLQIRAP